MGKKTAKERFTWTPQMDDAFVDAFYNQHIKGNRVDGTFTTKAYDEVVNELSKKLGMNVNKDKLKNRLKTIKSHFNECCDLFKNGLSGFVWSPETKMWSAEPEVWNSLIEAAPQAEKWRTMPISNFDKLLELFGKDKSSGATVVTVKGKRQRWACSTTNDIIESIQETPSSAPPQNGTCTKVKRKRVSSSSEDKNGAIIKAIESVAEVMKEGIALYAKHHDQSGIMEREVYNVLVAIGVDSCLIDESYLYLTSHPVRMRQFLGCPVERRKGILEKMMYGTPIID